MCVIAITIASGAASTTERLSASPGEVAPTWGNQGVVELPDLAFIAHMATQPDGSVVVAGSSTVTGEGIVTARLLPDGVRDATYGVGGRAVLSSSSGAPPSIGVDSSGRTLVAVSDRQSRRIVRLLPNGHFDRTYGSNGSAPVDFGAITDMVVESSGEVVVAGDQSITRLDASGATDFGFGTRGVVSTPGRVFILRRDAQGRLLLERTRSLEVCGAFRENPCTFLLDRYLPSGQPDASFGNGGSILLQRGGLNDITFDGQGRFLTLEVGRVFRYLEDGRPDTSFTDHGEGFGDLLVNAEGRVLVVAGGMARRQLPDGSGDQSFGRCGVAFEPDVSISIDFASPTPALLADGTVLSAATGHPGLDPNRDDAVIVGFQTTPGGPPKPYPRGSGALFLTSSGGTFLAGQPCMAGSLAQLVLNKPVVGGASTPTSDGYWMVAADGGVFTFGDARFFGSTGGVRLNKPVVGMAATPSGNGYWLVASDGGVFTFGDARFFGSTGGVPLNRPVLGMAAVPSGAGYRLLAADGGVFCFGAAEFFGSAVNFPTNQFAISIASSPTGHGYWVARHLGEFLPFGDAPGISGHGGMASENTNPFASTGSTVAAVLQ